MNWIKIDDETLALEGHPVQIKLEDGSFRLFVDGRNNGLRYTLAQTKRDGESRAKELAEFRG